MIIIVVIALRLFFDYFVLQKLKILVEFVHHYYFIYLINAFLNNWNLSKISL